MTVNIVTVSESSSFVELSFILMETEEEEEEEGGGGGGGGCGDVDDRNKAELYCGCSNRSVAVEPCISFSNKYVGGEYADWESEEDALMGGSRVVVVEFEFALASEFDKGSWSE